MNNVGLARSSVQQRAVILNSDNSSVRVINFPLWFPFSSIMRTIFLLVAHATRDCEGEIAIDVIALSCQNKKER